MAVLGCGHRPLHLGEIDGAGDPIAALQPFDGGALAPALWALGFPDESGVAQQMEKHPSKVARIVGGQPQLRPILHDTGKGVQIPRRDEASLVGAFLRPRVRKKNENTAQARRRQRGQKRARVIRKDAHVLQIGRFDLAQETGDSVHEGLATKKPDPGMGASLPGQMLAAAKSDFEPDVVQRLWKERLRIDLDVFIGEWNGKLRQQAFEPFLLTRTQAMAMTPAIEESFLLRLALGHLERNLKV